MRVVNKESWQKASVSFRVASTTSLAHNNRENTYGNPDINVNKIHLNRTYEREDIELVYQREFKEAIDEYNAKQKRSDRKIDDYYRKILNDNKTHHQRELIVAIGKKDDGIDEGFKINILDEYAKNFQKENPNLIIYNSVLHLDEANPHLHINYVPVFSATRGLKKRVGHEKAIQQQGYENFNEWQADQREVLEGLMNKNHLKREYVGAHEYLPVAEYKELKDEVKELEKNKESLEQTKEQLDIEVNARKQRLDNLPSFKNLKVEVESRPNRLNSNEVIIQKSDFEKLQKHAKIAKAQSDKANLYLEHAKKQQANANKFETQHNDLKEVNKNLQNKNFDLVFQLDKAEKKASKFEKKFNKLLEISKDFVHNIFDFLPDFICEKLHSFIKSFEKQVQQIEHGEQRRYKEVNRNRSKDHGLEL